MTTHSAALGLVLLALTLLPTGATAVPVGYELTLADEFDGTELDTSIWEHRLPGPRRDAVNTPDAVSLDGEGHLVIDTWTEDEIHYTGMIGTQNHFEQLYGWFEARIDFDAVPGMWSAFWLQSPDMGQFIGDPARAGVEMDIVEYDLFMSAASGPMWHGALHWDGYGASHKAASHPVPVSSDIDDGFHTFALEWTPTALRFYYDDQLMWDAPPVISHRSEYMILSSEVLNSFLSQVPEGGYGDRSESAARMRVDYVRVYSLVPEPATGLLLGVSLAALAGAHRSRRNPA